MLVLIALATGFTGNIGAQTDWFKGNLHTHSLWSDGDEYPEMIAEWYRTNGYHFLAISDHNILQDVHKWVTLTNAPGTNAFLKYLTRFGPDWIEQRMEQERFQVRLQPLWKYRGLFEEPGRFLMIQSEEITDEFKKAPIHLNATNLRDLIRPQKGTSVVDVIQRNVDAVLAQRVITGLPMFPHINHPNFGWALTAEDIVWIRGENFFEIYNGHPAVRNLGDAKHVSVERMWDIILTQRLTRNPANIIYAVAVDDAHNYHAYDSNKSNPGRGWVMVRAARLDAPSIIDTMEKGDFYASSGVRLFDVHRDRKRLGLIIEPEPGVTYRTQFIGTRIGYDPSSMPVIGTNGQPLAVTRMYSSDIGQVFAEVAGAAPSYTLKGNELYVRAKVISSKPKSNPYAQGEVEVAWSQPLVGASKRKSHVGF
ncbi:MAG: histidinol-phosphatase [Verrucomicrobia bacterium]|nr:MAG: histidinol-phosphatase [Verrucomicrobiota bacterium]